MSEQVCHHIAIACQDPIAIEKFYTTYFGFHRARVIPLGGEQIVFIKSNNAYLELFQSKEPLPVPRADKDGQWYPGWRHIAFKVDNIDVKLAEIGDAAVITLGPFDFSDFIPGWRTVWISDPEGNIIEISQGYVDEVHPPALR